MIFQRIETLSIFVLFYSILLTPFLISYSESANNSSFNGYESKGLQYCVTCHTPGISDNVSEPLYVTEKTSREFETYSSSSKTNQHGFPSGETKLCLGCHDGTVAIEDKNIYVESGQLLNSTIIGVPSHNEHPISIIYNSALAFSKGDLEDPSTKLSGLGGTIDEDLLENGKIVCTSCHAIHPMKNINSSNNHFNNRNSVSSMSLKISNSESKLCLTCHKK